MILSEKEKDAIIHAIEYTLNTIYPYTMGTDNCVKINAGRAIHSCVFLQHAQQILTETNETISP